MTALTKLYNKTPVALAAWIGREYGLAAGAQFGNRHRLRREAMAQRLRLYRDDVRLDFERMIDAVFVTEKVKTQRKAMIEMASEMNVSARIVDEVASAYNLPAMRSFKGDPAKTAAYKQRANKLGLDELMKLASRLTLLCNEILMWSVRTEEGEDPELHIITPDAFDAVPHPNNKLRLAGVLVDTAPSFTPEGADKLKVKYYELWDDEFTYHLNANGELLGEPIAHKLGRIPGVLFHREMPIGDKGLLDCSSGRDIPSAHLGVGLLEVMAMRLMKSQGERQPIVSGNLANTIAGQSFDGETPIILPEGVTVTMLESKTEPDHYLTKKRDKLTSVAVRYGMSYEQLIRSDSGEAGSGKAFVARRLKLIELRVEQLLRSRVHERETCELIGFDPVDLRVDHQEMAVPADAMEEIALLKEKLRLGLDSVVAYLMRKDPDLTREDAIMLIQSNVRDWAALVVWLRALNMPADANAENPGKSPQENGAANPANDNGEAPANDGANDGSGTPIADYAS